MVIEAFNLLRQSIISVEHDDVEMDEDDDESPEDGETLRRAASEAAGAAPADDDEMAEADQPEADMGAPAEGSAAPEKKKLTISYEKYTSMVNVFVSKVADDESGSGEGVDGEKLIEWYLTEKEDELANEEEYNNELALAKMVLRKMVKVRLRLCESALLSTNRH